MGRVRPLPSWPVILMHLGACNEAIVWARGRAVGMATIRAARPDWTYWLRARVKVKAAAGWPEWREALIKKLSGYGDGYGYGYGDGYGSGDGSGSGDGYGYGYGDGYGSGDGSGSGDGYGDGSGDGSGDGDGDGYGDGSVAAG